MAVLELEAPETPPPVRRKTDWRQPRLPTLAHYLALIRGGWIVLAVLTILGAVGGVLYAQTVPKMYQASASVELPDLPVYVDLSSVGPPPKRVTIDTTGQLAFSEPVLDAIHDKIGMEPEDASEAMTVSAYPLSRVIILTLEAETKEEAVAGADAAAKALVKEREAVLAGAVDRKNARELREKLAEDNRNGIEKYGYTPVAVRIQQDMNNISKGLQQYNNLKARVVNKAFPAKKVPPHSEVYVTTGAMMGFMVGVVWIWWRPRKRANVDHF